MVSDILKNQRQHLLISRRTRSKDGGARQPILGRKEMKKTKVAVPGLQKDRAQKAAKKGKGKGTSRRPVFSKTFLRKGLFPERRKEVLQEKRINFLVSITRTGCVPTKIGRPTKIQKTTRPVSF